MLQFKTSQTLLVCSLTLMISSACSKLGFVSQPAACEVPGSSVKFGLSGPVILYPTMESVVGGKVLVTGSCVSDVPVDIKESNGNTSKADCKKGMFSVSLELSEGDGQKDLLVSQNTAADGSEVVDRLCFMKDTTPPVVNIDTGTSTQSTNSTSSEITGTCESGLPVILNGPGLPRPVVTECNNGTFRATVQVVDGDGLKNIVGTQLDRAGNQGSDAGNVQVDTKAPEVRITSSIPVVTNLSSLVVSGTCETGLAVEIGDVRATTAASVLCAGGTFTATVPLNGGDGPIAAQVFQIDTAGNIGTDSKNLIKDTTVPVVTITSPLADAYLGNKNIFSGTCESGLSVELSGSVLQASRSVDCKDGQWSLSTNSLPQGDGKKTLTASQTDAAGNTAQAQRNFLVDTLAPVLAFTSPAANSSVGESISLTGTCEAGLTVQITGGGVLPATSTSCSNGSFAVTVSTSPLDGKKEVIASQIDLAGNTGSTSRTFLRDTLGPVLTISSPAADSYVAATVALTGTCEAGLTVAFSGAGLASQSSTVCAQNGTYSASLTLSSGDGTKSITAKETDSAGNSSTASVNYLRDTTPPAVAITSPAANTVAQTGLTVGGTCESGLDVTLAGSGVASQVVTACANGAFSAAVSFTNGGGTKTVSASQTDKAGNKGSNSRDFVSDLAPPTLTIDSPAANSYVSTNFTVQGICETGFAVTLGGAGLAAETAVTCTAGKYSGNVTVSANDGIKTVTAKQTDDVGNTATASREFLRDTQGPALTITSPAEGTTAQNGVLLVGTCENGLTITISGTGLSSPSTVTCASGQYQSNISFSDGDGPKAITVSETDAAGNTTQVSTTFNRDLTPPAIAITAPASNTAAQNDLTVSGTCETGLDVTLNGSGVATPVVTSCSNKTFSALITFTAGAGAKLVTASQKDAVGNTASDSRTFMRDLTAPTLTITSPAAKTYLAATFTLQGECETGTPVTLGGTGLASEVSTSCSGGAYSANLTVSPGDGTKTVTARQTDLVGNSATVSRDFLRDTQGPVLTITSPAEGSSAQNGLTLTGTCESGLSIAISGSGVSGSTTATCTSGTYQANISFSQGDGPKAITLSETDAAGNTTQVSATFNRDLTPPAIAITSPAANTEAQNGLTVGGTCETGLTVTLNGTGVSTPVTTSCTNGAFSAAITFSSGAGTKLVSASQTDAVGNTASDSRNFLRDLTGPQVTITSPAKNTYLAATFTLQGTCENGLPVVLSGAGIASEATVSCSNGTYSANLTVSSGDGTKVVTARQTDTSGNSGDASQNYLRDTQGPLLTITSPAEGTTAQNGITLVGTCETGLTVNFGGTGLASTSSVTCASGAYQAPLSFSAGDGVKAITVSETDAAGNTTQVSANFNRDLTPPKVTITSPDANTTAQKELVVGGTCETGLDVTLGGTGAAAPLLTSCTNGKFSATVSFSDGGGTKTITAWQTDAVGNVGSNSRNFMRDLSGPAVTITSPAANSYVGSEFYLEGTCEAGLTVQITGGGVLPATSTSCSNGSFAVTVSTSPLDGKKEVIASQIDLAGNTGSTSRTFLRDTLGPVLTISSPAADSYVAATVALTGTCEAGLTVAFSGAGLASQSSTVCAQNGTYSASLTLSSGDGTKSITAKETDSAGNSSTASVNYLRDTTPPAVAITSPAANTVAQTGLTVGGTCESGLDVTLAGSGVASQVVTACANGAFSAAISFTNGGGTKTVSASQTDKAGNKGSNSRDFERDLTPPTVTITSPAANSYLATTFTVQGQCETGLTVVFGGNALPAEATTSCNNGAYSASLAISSGDGTKTLTASQTDTVGNTASTSRDFLRDTKDPVLTITSPANGSTAQNGVTITGTCESGLTVTISGAGLSSPSTVTCASGQYQSNISFSNGDGPKAITVSETDAAGNTTQVSTTFNRDLTPPAIAITSPEANTAGQNGLTVGGTCETGLTVTLNGAGVSTPVTTSCSSGVFSAAVSFTNGAGTKQVTASQTDAVGNVGSSSRTFTRDLTAPTVTITSPAENTYLASTFTLQGACESGLPVALSGAGLASSATATCSNGAYSVSLNVSNGDGTKTITAQQTDGAGNVGQTSKSYLRDATAPSLSITSPTANSSVPTSVDLTGTCETGLLVSVSGDLTSTSGSCVAGAFTVNVTFSSGLGTKNVQIRQTDAAGNVGQASSAFLRDSNGNVETFVADASFGKIDILFIDDNSASMDPNQASLGAKFSGFSTELLNIDWQIGITTTDCSTGPYGICGTLLDLTGYNSKILTPQVPDYQTVFNNSIRRPETVGCLNTGTCPAGASEPLLAATTAMTKYNALNNGFFRSNADLAIVILSDADERQTGGSNYGHRPSELVSTFNSIWPTGKKLKVYSIIVKPKDAACLSTMKAGSGGFSFYGDLIDQTVQLTSGLSTSICAPDYSVTLKSIGESVRTLTNSVELAHTPIANSVSVQLTPNQNITFKVIDNKVVFDSPPSVGTEIKVNYRY